MEYNIKGVDVGRVNTYHNCQYEGCKRPAFYKYRMANAVGKAIMNCARTFRHTIQVLNKDGTPKHDKKGKLVVKEEMLLETGAGYFCSFDCARKYLLYHTFEAKVPLTPLIRDYLGQGKVPITDHETILENIEDISIEDFSKHSLIKISPNAWGDKPYLLDVSVGGRNFPIRLSRTGVVKMINSLQLLINEEQKILEEKNHMQRRKKNLTKE